MEIGQMNFKVMSILDAGETGNTVTRRQLRSTSKRRRVNASDFRSRSQRSLQPAGTDRRHGVNVYTHGEMLPAHGYPELRNSSIWSVTTAAAGRISKWSCSFPRPHRDDLELHHRPNRRAYDDRIWTRSIVGWPGVRHLMAKISLQSLPRRNRWRASRKRNSAPDHRGLWSPDTAWRSDTLIDLVSREKLRHIFLLGGVTAHAASVTISPISPPACRRLPDPDPRLR